MIYVISKISSNYVLSNSFTLKSISKIVFLSPQKKFEMWSFELYNFEMCPFRFQSLSIDNVSRTAHGSRAIRTTQVCRTKCWRTTQTTSVGQTTVTVGRRQLGKSCPTSTLCPLVRMQRPRRTPVLRSELVLWVQPYLYCSVSQPGFRIKVSGVPPSLNLLPFY